MKIRLYDSGMRYGKNSPDRYSLYFPYPKWMQKQIYESHKHHSMGFVIGCSEDCEGGVSFEDDRTLGYHVNCLGRKISLDKMSLAFRKWALSMEKKWNDALKFNDEKHWEIWNEA